MRGVLLGALLASTGCTGIVTRDCRFFEDCEMYRPEGLACGLANLHGDSANGQHVGASCLFEWDPAIEYTTASIEPVSARPQRTACPPGHTGALIGDKSGFWTDAFLGTCAADGNLATSSGALRDVPAGATCGLGRTLDQAGRSCEGYLPELGDCPPGWDLRWIPDAVTDSQEDCTTVDGFEGYLQGNEFRVAIPMTFCTLKPSVGLVASEFDPTDPRHRAQIAGSLCGLHFRGANRVWLESGDDILDPFFEALQTCVDTVDPDKLAPHLVTIHEDLEEPYYREPQCLGRPVRADPDDACPEGLELTCAADYLSEADWPVYWHCWCDLADSKQIVAQP